MNLPISLAKILLMKKVLGIGNALVDVMTVLKEDQILEKFSLPKGSMQLVDNEKSDLIKKGTSNLKRNLASGGSAANTIHGLAKLGIPSGFIGSIGSDETGNFFENDMHKAGVDTILLRRKSVTGTAVALISPDSERTFATHLGAAVELEAGDLNPDVFRKYHLLYLEGYLMTNKSLVEQACKYARANKMEIAIDLASYNVVDAYLKDFKYIIEKYADIVFANEEEAKSYTGEKPEKALEIIAEQCNIAIIKTGKKGSLIKHKEELIKVGALPVTCIDTTGAGDLYAAGFLNGYAGDLELDKCGCIGALLAGNAIETVGAKIENSRWPAIKKAISQIINE
jgi:sugar/nucleoside kinase (ribokinase family)